MNPGDLVRIRAECRDFYLYREVAGEDYPHFLGRDDNLVDSGPGLGMVLGFAPRRSRDLPGLFWVRVLLPDGPAYADPRWLEVLEVHTT